MKTLRGTTWAHVRAVAPLAAASEWFADARPDLAVSWSTHSARQFGEGPVESLTDEFDLVCFDHPHTGHIAQGRFLLALDEHLAPAVLADREAGSAGASFASYRSDGHQWAIPIDAACTMSAFSPRKLEAFALNMPCSLDDVIRMAAERPGMVMQPFSRMTTTAMFFAFSVSLSCLGAQRLDARTFEPSLDMLRRLFAAANGGFGFGMGSIESMKLLMQVSSDTAYVPFAYPYSCFARTDLVADALQFGPHPALGDGMACRGVLGGAGIGVSAKSGSPSAALTLLEWLTSAECQSTIFPACLGQPADRRAWTKGSADTLCQGFFSMGIGLLDAAWLRPTDAAFCSTQSLLADELLRFLSGTSRLGETSNNVNRLLARYTS